MVYINYTKIIRKYLYKSKSINSIVFLDAFIHDWDILQSNIDVLTLVSIF